MASNSHGIKDPQGQYDDWIEIYNTGATTVNTAGMYLTNDWADPTKWRIPADRAALTTIQPHGYVLVWADGDTGSTGLHAGFRLSSGGGQLALFNTDGRTPIDSVEFGPQTPNVSYGRDPTAGNEWRFFGVPTPGAANTGAYLGVVADLKFSHERGFYTEPLAVEITTKTPGAGIFYMVDGTSPFDSQRGVVTGRPYAGPISITTTTCLRAIAVKAGWMSTKIETHTYFFLDDVIRQATDPATGAQVVPPGYPTTWPGGSYSGAVIGDYQMDPDVVGQNGRDIFGGLYAKTIKNDLKSVPTMSLVMDKDSWFGPTGIYVNQSQDGSERVCSIEWIDPNGQGSFQTNSAMATQGGISHIGTTLDRWKSFKLSLRPRFKTTTDDGTPTGGPATLDYRVFPDSPVAKFDTIVIDEVLSNVWTHPSQGASAMYIQDQYVSDLHNGMGGHSPHGLFAHVYLNGLYWGMYNVHERPDHSWAAQMFGGEKEEYDAIKHNSSSVINNGAGGSATANFNTLLTAANAVQSDPANLAKYNAVCNLLDVDDFIAYLLANWFAGNTDWPAKNWYATHRNTPDGKWRFHSWDADHALEGSNDVGKSPADLHVKLAASAEYRLRFADLIHRHFFNGGPCSYPASANEYRFRMNQIDRAIVGESARWGDNRRSLPYTRQDWLNVQNGKLTSLFPTRTNLVLGWLKSANLYPIVDAPEFNVNGQLQHGGHIGAHDSLTMTPGGTIWYTLDGTDLRVPGTALTPTPAATVLVPESAAKRVLVPTAPVSDAWRSDPAFNDASWQSGSGGVGYERSTGYETLFKIDVGAAMYGKVASCYIRIPFTVTADALQGLTSLLLKVRYDDGFVAYLNGAEVQRALFTGTPAWNSAASASHADADAVNLETFDISSRISSLHAGTNLLAIQGLNESTTSSDFLISVELSASKGSAGGATPSGVSASAVRYTGPITLSKSTLVKARVLSGTTWSALNEAVFAVGPVAQSLRISELMYHPLNTGNPNDPNAEFVELTNIAGQSINLNLVRFTDGIDYTFPSFDLPAGGYCLIVKSIAAFQAKYGSKPPVVGQYTGSLSNAGEHVELVDAAGTIIQSFTYDDHWFKITDGLGFSLTVTDPKTTDANSLNDQSTWRPSAFVGGSPGSDDRGQVPELGAVVINELLANSQGIGPDWIELCNTTNQAIDIGDWFLSDDANDLTKYKIAAGTSIPAGGYLVFYQDKHFGNEADPGCKTAFGLSKDGETVYLHSGSNGVLTGYSQQEKFDASEVGVSLGRYPKSTGSDNFVALSAPTPGKANAVPAVGPVVINEIMYHPLDMEDAEYVELLNISSSAVMLYDAMRKAPWRFTDDPQNPSIELLFPTDAPVTLAPGEYMILAKDASMLRTKYSIPANVKVLAWGAGNLANGGQKIQLSKPGDQDAQGNRSWIRLDRVVYSDGLHPQDFAEGVDTWPVEANGKGKSLGRINPQAYGNDPVNWRASTPSPGQ